MSMVYCRACAAEKVDFFWYYEPTKTQEPNALLYHLR
jgi:hypothetical protein